MKQGLIALGLVLTVLLAACAPQAQQPTTYTQTAFTPNAELSAQHFNTNEELLAFIKGAGTAQGSLGGIYLERYAAAPMATGGKTASLDSSAGAYSQTNNQVASVDEADIIKTDGKYIYTVSGTTLFIIQAGEEAKIVSRIELDSQPTGLFIDGDNVAVMGNFYDLAYFKKINYRPRNGMTYLNIYDTANKEKPVLTKEYKFEGNYFQARMHEDNMYLVLTSTPEYNKEYPTPIIFEGTTRTSVAPSDVFYFPVPYNNVQFVTIHSISMKTGERVEAKTIAVEGANTLYMSEDNMYLAYTKYINEWEIRQRFTMQVLEPKLTDADKALIKKIEATDDDVLSQWEKESKVYQVYNDYLAYLEPSEQQTLNDDIDRLTKKELEKYEALEYTIINKVHIDNGAITVGPTGEIPGHLNNQFALDEYNGVLRAATTINGRWGWIRPLAEPIPVDIGGGIGDTAEATIAPDEKRIAPPQNTESENRVYTLSEDLDVLDHIDGIATGETIYSTRFVGDKLYMVTFRQVDPFFVIDLSDPRDIKALGELKIPGFSRYLHPYDENTLIGIGRDATDLGRQQGIKIALFDVSDVEKPKQLASWSADEEYSQTTAEWEHKAFLFDREKNLLVIPAYSYSYDYKTGVGKEQYNGAMVFDIERDKIELRGIVDHASNQQYWGSLVERSLYIDDLLYTKSPGLLRVNALSDLHSVTNVTLSGTNASPYPVY